MGGRVAAVHVQEGQRVQKDQVLVELEPFDLLERLQQAEANLAAQQANFDRLQNGYRAEEDGPGQGSLRSVAGRTGEAPRRSAGTGKRSGPRQLEVAKAQLVLAQQNHARVVGLVEKRAAAAEELDRAGEQLKAATATVALREQELNLLEVGTRQEDLERIAAQVEEACKAWQLTENGYRREEIAAAEAARDAAQFALRCAPHPARRTEDQEPARRRDRGHGAAAG